MIALFCFLVFYYTEDRMRNADILFVIGLILLLISIVLLFVGYLQITVTDTELILRGLPKTRIRRYPLSAIQDIQLGPYSEFHLNNPRFAVRVDNKIVFYCTGRDAVRVQLHGGENLIIGSLRAAELALALQKPGMSAKDVNLQSDH